MSDFNHTHYPTARTEHRCQECSRTIGKGERYSRTAAVWCGDFFTNVACLHCAVARFILDATDTWYSESFYSGLADALSESASEHGVWALRLLVCLQRQWRRFDGARLMDLPRNPWPGSRYPAVQIAWATEGRRAAA